MPATDPTDKRRHPSSAKTLLIVLGDQLDQSAPVITSLDKEDDAVLMMEVKEEAEHVPSHKQRTTLFLAAMRHFASDLIDKGYRVRYVALDDRNNRQSFGEEVKRAVNTLHPERVVVQQPGEHRVQRDLEDAADELGVELEIVEDEHFFAPLDRFYEWADGRKALTMEYFYRERRRETGYLMKSNGKDPVDDVWNLDKENRETFDAEPDPPAPYKPRPTGITNEVMALVEKTWPNAPGSLESFAWPVTREQALRALDDFIEHRLAKFGTYEDAMWTGEPFLYHAVLSPALNLKLLTPRECVEKAVAAYEEGRVTLNNCEGFVRQLLGWREFIRGVYFLEGPGYPHRNGLEQTGKLPGFFWDADTDMRCLRECLGSVVEHAYSHHIPRLMVIGNFALIAGVNPREVHEWFLAMYADAVEWATAPNVVGMSQHADRRPDAPARDTGVVGTKPYAASGKYINKMSNYCKNCRYDVKQRTGEDACPFNTLYWDFLIRHRETFRSNNRMAMVLKNVDRLDDAAITDITHNGERIRQAVGVST